MFRDFLKSLSDAEQAQFCNITGTSWETITRKYMPASLDRRSVPRRDRFETLLNAINTIRPGSISREQLASYFYAAPSGQDRGQGADAA